MAAAYAALVSLTHIIEQIMERHARHPIFLNKQQRQIESLQEKVSFLQDFLEVYSHGGSNEAKVLESQITVAAYDAQDIIESHAADAILSQRPKEKNTKKIKFTSQGKSSPNHFSPRLQKVIENIDFIRKEALKIEEKCRVEDLKFRNTMPVVSSRPSPTGKDTRVEDLKFRNPMPVVSSRPSPTGKDTMMEYYDDDLEQIMDKLTGQSSNLQIIPIVGMGGIGKTTLARYVYEDSLIVECFYIRGWVTVSQEYSLRDILLDLLQETGVPRNGEQECSEYNALGVNLYQHLSCRKYLIIMDDIWSIEVCEELKRFFPDNNNGSRVMVTTRLSTIADIFGSSNLYKMNLLDENKSWSLLCKNVFGHRGNCPLELEEIGKDIAKNCKGLPLSIVVIGRLLSKSQVTQKYWEYVAKDINTIINSEDSGHWSKILYLSYSHLPIHLKPCFLYMGVFPEDCKIRVSQLIKLWVAEGFLKPNTGKSLEEVAQDYLEDLIERNLILVREWGSVGEVKTCSIHDLLRDLCLTEARKEMFLYVVKVHNHAQSVENERRVVFHEHWSHVRDSHLFDYALQSTTFIHSLTCDFSQWSSSWQSRHNLRLLRVLTVANTHSLNGILHRINLRYLKFGLSSGASPVLSPISRLWYLQILIFTGLTKGIDAPKEIWEMPQLRHIMINKLHLPNPSDGQLNRHDDLVLKNLQTLLCIKNFQCTEEILRRIPNVKKLSIANQDSKIQTGSSNYYCLHNVNRLHKLRSLSCFFTVDTDLFQNLSFPQSLKKLTLHFCNFEWDDITTKVGSLPHLEKLKLNSGSAGDKWNMVEGKFLRLKFLEIKYFKNLACWIADSTDFPLLERLVLIVLRNLKEIPSSMGDTLKSIHLVYCKSSVIASAKEIVEEQQSLGNEGLHLSVHGMV